MKKDIVINFPKQKKFIISKLNQKPKKVTEKSARKFAAEFIDIKNFIKANQNCVHSNLKFGLTSKKPER